MSTLLPIDALATPRRLGLDPPMTDAELFEFCQQNDILRVERTREGVIRDERTGRWREQFCKR